MIEIKREKGWNDQYRKYKVILNEEKIGTIGAQETFKYQLDPGRHTLYLKIDWCRSKKVEFEIQSHEVLTFKCGGLSDSKSLATLWYITFGRNNYLWIKPSE